MSESARATNAVADADLLARLPRHWWWRQFAWQAVETTGRLAFLLALAVLAARLLTGQSDHSLYAWVAAGGLLLRWLGQQGQARHALEAGETALLDLHEGALHGAMAPRRRRISADQAARATVLNQQIDRVAPYWQAFLPALLAAAWQPFIVLAIVASADWLAGVLLAVCAPLIPGFAFLIGIGSARVSRQEHQRLQRLGSLFFDRLKALPTLRLMNASARARADLRRATEGLKTSTLRVLRIAFLSSAVLEFFTAVSIAALAMYIGLALLGAIDWGPAGQMNLTRGLIVLLLAPEFFAPLRTLAQRYHERSDARSAALEPLALADSAPVRVTEPAVTGGEAPRLTLRSLSVSWPGAERSVLQDVNLELDAGEWLTLYGASGSGKTTLASTLAGQLAWQGELMLNSQALCPDQLRGSVAWVDQTPVVFNASVRANLAPGQDRIDPQRLTTVLSQTGLTELIESLPLGLDTRLGEGGIRLSGGQAQRLAVARALLPGARLLVLDEPTAQLDRDAELAFLRVLRRLAGQHTIVLFAHSPRARQAADRALTVEQWHAG